MRIIELDTPLRGYHRPKLDLVRWKARSVPIDNKLDGQGIVLFTDLLGRVAAPPETVVIVSPLQSLLRRRIDFYFWRGGMPKPIHLRTTTWRDPHVRNGDAGLPEIDLYAHLGEARRSLWKLAKYQRDLSDRYPGIAIGERALRVSHKLMAMYVCSGTC